MFKTFDFKNWNFFVIWCFVFVLSAFVFSKAAAGPLDNLDGFAWSSNVGWISFNCENTDCTDSNYGVSLGAEQNGQRAFSGFAWSSNVGWVSLNAQDVAGCPGGGTCAPVINTSTNQAQGWGKALAGNNDSGDGWDGWVKLGGQTTDGQAYAAELVDSRYFQGWSWAGENGSNGNPDGVIGWISWSCDNRSTCGTAEYRVQFKNVTINVAKSGNGLVVSGENPPQINCGDTCSGEYLVGTQLTLTAYPDNGYVFGGWTNCDPPNTAQCSLTADYNKVVHATFNPANLYTGVRFVDDGNPPVPSSDGEGGSVTEAAHSISCSDGECGYNVAVGDQLDLTANPAAGYVFVRWFSDSGNPPCANSLANPCSFVKQNTTETAKAQFRKTQCNNGRDDDGDHFIDENDPQCSGIADDTEDQNESGFSSNCPADGPGACPACNDGIDNDNPPDGLIDYRGFCSGAPSATNQSDCSDAATQDHPTTWYPADPGCSGSRYRTTEGGLNNVVHER